MEWKEIATPRMDAHLSFEYDGVSMSLGTPSRLSRKSLQFFDIMSS